MNKEMNLRVDAIKSIWKEVTTFTTEVKTTENGQHWELYVTLSKSKLR